ncbi:MAG: ATP-binding protein [Bacteroidota bacterium]
MDSLDQIRSLVHTLPSSDLLIRALEAAASGITIADFRAKDMPLIYANPAYARLTGYSIEEALGKNCRYLQGEESHQVAIHTIRIALKESKPCKVLLKNFKKDGTPFWNELTLSPVFDEKGVATHYIGIQDDVSARIANQQLIVDMKNAALEASKAKSEFLNIMSHELRTPLTVMLGNLHLLSDETDLPPPTEVVEIVHDIETAGKHLLAMVNEVLDLAKIESGYMNLNPTAIDGDPFVRAIIDAFRPLTMQKSLDLEASISVGTFHVDPQKLKQILLNLIGNAIKFTPTGGVYVRGWRENHKVWFEVKDTGIGIAEKNIPMIFELFRQVDSSSTRENSGTGLGLTISKRLIEMHGGRIYVESKQGEGSKFIFWLPDTFQGTT